MEIKEMRDKSYQVIEDYNRKHSIEHNKDLVFFHLIEEIGELAREINNGKAHWKPEFNKEKFDEELVDVLSMVLNIAKDNNVDIETVFNNKLKKLRQRFDLD